MAKSNKSEAQLFTEKGKNKNPLGKRVFNVRSILEKKFHTIFDTEKAKAHPDTEMWRQILGDLEGRCKIMVYGRSGSGKSVFVLQLIQYLTEVFGKGIYNSWEEKVNKTLKNRIVNFMKVDPKTNNVPNIWFMPAASFDEMCKLIQKYYARIIVIDSVQYAHFTMDQLKEMDRLFSKRNLIVIMVSFGTTEGKTRGVDDLLHASDIKCYVHKGELSVTNRYLKAPFKRQLFDPSLSVEVENDDNLVPDEKTLFNQETDLNA